MLLYLNHMLDLWVEKVIKPKIGGEVQYVRYADDFLMFQYESDARAAMEVLKERLGSSHWMWLRIRRESCW